MQPTARMAGCEGVGRVEDDVGMAMDDGLMFGLGRRELYNIRERWPKFGLSLDGCIGGRWADKAVLVGRVLTIYGRAGLII